MIFIMVLSTWLSLLTCIVSKAAITTDAKDMYTTSEISIETNMTLREIMLEFHLLKNIVLQSKQQTHDEVIRLLNKTHASYHSGDRSKLLTFRKQIRQIISYLRTLKLDIRQLSYEALFIRRRLAYSLNGTKVGWDNRFHSVLSSMSNISDTVDGISYRIDAIEEGMKDAGIAVPTPVKKVVLQATKSKVITHRGATVELGCEYKDNSTFLSGNVSITWSKTEGMLNPGAVTADGKVVLNDVRYSDNGTYVCHQDLPGTQVIPATVHLIVRVPTVTLTAKTDRVTVFRGGTAVLGCTISGDLNVTGPIEWTRRNGVLPNGSILSDGRLVIEDVLLKDAGTYICAINMTDADINPGTVRLKVEKETMVRVKLVGGSGPHEGRVELLHQNRWGTVCDDRWDEMDARVVCRMLGYTLGGRAETHAHFGAGSGPIWMDDVDCLGTEDTLEDCHANPWGDHSCYHQEDAGVHCYNDPSLVTGIRLVGGRLPGEGRVELNRLDVWGGICDEGWDDRDATVVCRMLGFNSGGFRNKPDKFGHYNVSAWMTNIRCHGDEKDIFHCGHRDWGPYKCSLNNYAALTCA